MIDVQAKKFTLRDRSQRQNVAIECDTLIDRKRRHRDYGNRGHTVFSFIRRVGVANDERILTILDNRKRIAVLNQYTGGRALHINHSPPRDFSTIAEQASGHGLRRN